MGRVPIVVKGGTGLLILLLLAGMGCGPAPAPQTQEETDISASEPTLKPSEIEASRRDLDERVWKPELDAQRHEASVVRLWDDIRFSGRPYASILALPLQNLSIPTDRSETFEGDRFRQEVFEGSPRTLDPEAWRNWVGGFEKTGYAIEMTEWHLPAFDPATETSPALSHLDATLYVRHTGSGEKTIVHLLVEVPWVPDTEPPQPREARITRMTLRRSSHPDSFAAHELMRRSERISPREILMPVLARDLDRDGLPDLVLPAANAWLHNRGNFQFTRERLFLRPMFATLAGIIDDFDGDGVDDIITAGAGTEVRFVRGKSPGEFENTATLFDEGKVKTDFPGHIAAADIDHDGDLDVLVTQYLPPYAWGQMPSPFYDARDGRPSHLFRNEGGGKFVEITKEAGLEPKQGRRTYSASFLDLNEDSHLDLMVISDFAGIDLYLNDGKGVFRDVTGQAFEDPHNFGMSHLVEDFNGDLRPDIYVVGMSSTTARRLDYLGLGKEAFPETTAYRMKMGLGNKLYLQKPGTGQDVPSYVLPEVAGSLTRTGWSWGCATVDYNNDGLLDMYIANGHVSGESCRDYCSTFWRHDINSGASIPREGFADFFRESGLKQVYTYQESWDGYQKNVLFHQSAAGTFHSISYLEGIAEERDSRAVLVEDFNNDGRLDICYTTMSADGAGNQAGVLETVNIFENRIANPGNWIGILLPLRPGNPLTGTFVDVKLPNRTIRKWWINGDGYRIQRMNRLHFGLGDESRVDQVTIRFPNGKEEILQSPAINAWHPLPGD